MSNIKKANKQNFKKSQFDFRSLIHSNKPIVKAFEHLTNRIKKNPLNQIDHKECVYYPIVCKKQIYLNRIKCQICGLSISMNKNNCIKMFPKLVNNIIWSQSESYFKTYYRRSILN